MLTAEFSGRKNFQSESGIGTAPAPDVVFRALAKNSERTKDFKVSCQHRAQNAGRGGAASNARGGRGPDFDSASSLFFNQPAFRVDLQCIQAEFARRTSG